MEDLSKIIDKKRIPIEIKIHPYLKDHHFEGTPVLPAVEALQSLAISTKQNLPEIDVRNMYDASFLRFLGIQPDARQIDAFNEIELFENGDAISKLITIAKSKSGSITRAKEHISVKYKKEAPEVHELPFDIASTIDGICFEIPSSRLYKELVPFGPSYHNVKDTFYLTDNGASGYVSGATHAKGDLPLGSPFPSDAAFHIACVWGQRYHGIVGFPAGFQKRFIIEPTSAGETYYSRIIPVKAGSDQLIFDIWIFDSHGNLREIIKELKMEDLSRGRMKPPEWIQKNDDELLNFVQDHCKGLSVVELDTITDFAPKALSEDEQGRFKRMGKRRIKSFMGARMTSKLLSRKLAGNDMSSPSNTINTVIPDEPFPRCPLPDGSDPFFCSVSHDKRFAIAVGSSHKIGVDVEGISERILKGQHHYMNDAERKIANSSPIGAIPASLRIWSIKEAVTKALRIKLTQSWRMAEVTEIGLNMSKLLINGRDYTAYHETIDDHLFTILEIED